MIVGEHMVYIISHSVMAQRNTVDLHYLQNMDIGLVIATDLITYALMISTSPRFI